MMQTGPEKLGKRNPKGWVVIPAAAMAVVLVAIAARFGTPIPTPSVVAFPSTPALACHPPVNADKGGQVLTFDWHIAVETDRATGSAILFVSGSDLLVCRVSRSDDGSLGMVSTSLSRVLSVSPPRLTVDTASGVHDGDLEILIGRVPAATTAVWVDGGDGTDQLAAVGNGYYLSWLTTPGMPVRIDALDVNAHLLQRLEDPAGIQIPS